MYKVYCFAICLFLLYSCVLDKIETRKIKVINNTNRIMYCFMSESDNFTKPYINYPVETYDEFNIIKINSFNYVENKELSWDLFIEKYCDEGKLRLFIVSKDSIDKYGWKKVLSENIHTKVYKLNLEDIKKSDWTINYNGK
jgi:hypothetical protein